MTLKPATVRTLKTGAAFLLACFVAFTLEHYLEHLVESKSHPAVTESLFDIGGLYQSLVTAGPRQAIAKFTVIVDDDIRSDKYYAGLSGPTRENCPRRKGLALLIERIASAGPAVIVVDRAFLPDQCLDDDPATRLLQSTIASVSAAIPVVVGRSVMPGERRLYDTLAFAGAKGQLDEGLMELDPDTRKLPLNFAVHPAKPGADWEWVESLSFKAAKAYDQRLQDRTARLQKLMAGSSEFRQDATHPFISFLAPGELTILRPSEIFCRHPTLTSAELALPCESGSKAMRELHGKIVVLSSSNESDKHRSVLGTVPGYVLHANYIEALLDQRYFQPSPWLDFVVGFLIFASILVGMHFDQFIKTLAWWGATLAVAYLLVYFVIMHSGYYVNPVAVSVLALIINAGHLVFSRIHHHLMEKKNEKAH